MKPTMVQYVGLRKLEMPIVMTVIPKVRVFSGKADGMIILKFYLKNIG